MAMNNDYLNAIADHGGGLATYIGLVDETGTELSGGSPSYARQSVTWTSASSGTIRPTADLTFDIPASTTVGGWRAYSAATSGTDYGGASLTNETYASQGEYTLLSAGTGILHSSS